MGAFDKKSSDGLREKYNHAIQTAKSLHMQGGAEERDGKLYFNGTVKSADEKNQIWNALKTVPDWEKEVVADIKVQAAPQPAPTTGSQGAAPGATITYTVQSGFLQSTRIFCDAQSAGLRTSVSSCFTFLSCR